MSVTSRAPLIAQLWTRHSMALVALGSFIFTICICVAFPAPECVKCEFGSPWGRDEDTFALNVLIYECWLFLATMGSVLLARFSVLIVSIPIIDGHLVSQWLTGVAAWSLLDNEGPIILIIDLFIAIAALCIGILIRSFLAKYRLIPTYSSGVRR